MISSLLPIAYPIRSPAKDLDTREWFQIEMRKIGFSFADSKANFIFATHESEPAKEIFEAAKKERFMSVILISQESIII